MRSRSAPAAAACIVIAALASAAAPAQAALPNCNVSVRVYTQAGNEYRLWPEHKSAANITLDCVLATGNSGPAVAALQTALNRCNGQAISADGVFGPRTRAAVIAVQRAHGLTQDGVYGPRTRDAMAWPYYSSASGGLTRCG